MAIARIKKIRILAHDSIRDVLMDTVQHTGVLDINKTEEVSSITFSKDSAVRLDEASLNLAQIDEMVKYLHSYEPDMGFLESMSVEKITLKADDFRDIQRKFDYRPIYETFQSLLHSLKEIQLEKEKQLDAKDRFLPWEALEFDPLAVTRLKYASVIFGTISSHHLDALFGDLDENKVTYYHEKISDTQEISHVVISCLKREKKLVHKYLSAHDFNEIALETDMLVRSELKAIDDELIVLRDKEELVNKEIASLLKYKNDLLCLHDYYSNLKKRLESEEKFLDTKKAFVMEGWIKNYDIAPLQKRLARDFTRYEVQIFDPGPSDVIPVDLRNRRLLRPFEFVTTTYGLPKYGELDPTPLLAPFFFIFLGFCLTDMAYGLIIAAVSLWGLTKVKTGRTLKKFLWLLVIGGCSAAVFGMLTGGFFGDLLDVLGLEYPAIFGVFVKIKHKLTLLNTHEDPIKLLVIALTLGIVQLCVGHLIAFYDNVRKGRFLDGLLDQGSMFLFMIGFTGSVLIVLEIASKSLMPLFGTTLLVGSLAIILTAGRTYQGIGAKLFNGGFILYQVISGYISDVLSYSRLWALGLVTGVMAMTCNVIAFMIGKMIPFVGFLFTILILIFGHAFTIAINLLSSLIHSGRLQYVEFFPKFFKGGGREFAPLSIHNKYTYITDVEKRG